MWSETPAAMAGVTRKVWRSTHDVEMCFGFGVPFITRRTARAVQQLSNGVAGMADAKRLRCPKCEVDGRPTCTRFHMVQIDGSDYIRCERKECGWKAELAAPSRYLARSTERLNET